MMDMTVKIDSGINMSILFADNISMAVGLGNRIEMAVNLVSPGAKGEPGQNGASVVNAYVNANEHLIIVLDNNVELDAGQVRAEVSVQATSKLEFPNVGNERYLYVDQTADKIYRWDKVNLKYYCIGSDYEKINLITGGNANE